jgi:hypothetical protein
MKKDEAAKKAESKKVESAKTTSQSKELKKVIKRKLSVQN